MGRDAIAELLNRSRRYATAGKYELFKTSSLFDGTANNKEWLGDDLEAVTQLGPLME